MYYNDYGYIEQAHYLSNVHQLHHDLNHLRYDLKTAIDEQTKKQSEDAEKMRTNQTTLFGKLIDNIKSIFTGKKSDGTEESFYKMVMRENDETQEYLSKQEKTTNEKLTGIIKSLNDISDDIEANTSGGKKNAESLKNAIANLKTIVIPTPTEE